MKLSFDKFERYELPQVTLCNPNSRATEVDGKITITDTVGVLSNPKGMNLKLNFNAPHELSFDYYRHKSSDPIKQSFYDSIYKAIQTDRYIYLTDIGYFIISSVTDSDEDNIDKKSITCKSCEENELAIAEGLYLKEGTYYLCSDNNDGLLDLFLPKTTGWTMGYIDPSLLTKPYYVEETEVDNGYNFLYTTVQDMYECIVEPDIIKRTISVYSRTYYAEHHLTDIHIAKYNLLKHKTVEENDEDKYTALNVQGKDENLEIRAVNPTGKNVIYNFEPRYSWMSPALQQAIEKWQAKRESVEDEYLTLQQGYYAELELLFNEEQNIEVLKGELKTLEETRDAVIVTVGEQQSTALDNVNAQISTKQTEINTKTSEYDTHKETVRTTYEVPISQINSDCALDVTAKDIDGNTIFTTDLLNELMTHIKPTDYVDEYMLVTESMTYSQRFEKAKELMDRAQSQLVKISSGQKIYSIDTRSFLFNKQFRYFSEQLCAGAIIYVETKNDILEQLHLTGIDINFDEKSTNFTLGNKYDRSDLKALYEDALGQNSKSFSELKYIASIIEDQQKQLDYQRNWVADLRTLTLDNVLTSKDQAIEINNRGLIGRKRRLDENGNWDFDENGNPYFEDEQVKLINNTLVFTKDNWNSAEAAIGKIAVGYNANGSVKYDYGFNGRVLIGELILGNNLVLTGVGAGIKIKDDSGKDAFYADNEGNLVLLGHIIAKSLTLEGCKISTDNISGLSNVAISGNYNDLQNRPTIPSSLADLGLDTSAIIYKGDIKQSEKVDSNGISYTQTTVPTTNGNITYDTYPAGDYIVFGRSKGTNSEGKDYICVSKEGLLTARNALIYGTVYATDGEFIGSITATSGKIGGWDISSNKITKTAGTSTVRICAYNDYYQNGRAADVIIISDTSNGTTTYPFIVRKDGELECSKLKAYGGTIGGWNIIPKGLQYFSGNTLKCFLSGTGTQDNNWTVGSHTGKDWTIWANGTFGVTNAGKLYATGAEISGNISATNGTIGGWNIETDKLYKAPDTDNANAGTGMATSGYGGNPAFWAGYTGYGNNPWEHASNRPSGDTTSWTAHTKCYITNNGKLYAQGAEISGKITSTDADIEGKITANDGDIAGWTIDTNKMTKTVGTSTVRICAYNDYYQDGRAADVIVISDTSNGTTTYPFIVRKDGELECSKLKAHGGTIGGWNITPNYLDCVRDGNRIYLNATAGQEYFIWAGPSSNSGGKFMVDKNGVLTANGAIINGNITLNDGSILMDGVVLGNNGHTHFRDYGNTGTIWQEGTIDSPGQHYVFVQSGLTTMSSNGISVACNGDEQTGYLSGKWQISGGYITLNSPSSIDIIATNNIYMSGTASIDGEPVITSDKNVKNTISTIDESYSILFDNLHPVTYKYNYGTSNRLHTGFIAQEVEDALKIANINTRDFAAFVIDNKEDSTQEYGLRYGEFIALNTWQIQHCKKRIVALENTVAELKTQIQTLTAG